MVINNKTKYLIGVGIGLICLAATGCDTAKKGDTTATAPAAPAASAAPAGASPAATKPAAGGGNQAASDYGAKVKQDGVEPGKR